MSPLRVFLSLVNSAVEEFYWRWFVYGQLRRLLPVARAHALAGAAFAAHHVVESSPSSSPRGALIFGVAVGLGGVIMSVLYERRRTLCGAWVCHLVVDLGIMGIGYGLLLKAWQAPPLQAGGGRPHRRTTSVTLPLWLPALIVLLAAPSPPSTGCSCRAPRWFIRQGTPRPGKINARASDRGPALQAHEARGPDRPAPLRPAGRGIGGGLRQGAGHAPRVWSWPGAQRYAARIVPAFNAYLYFPPGLCHGPPRGAPCSTAFGFGYSDEAGLAAIPKGATVVFVMNHRSNMDYILVSFLAAERVALSYAVGEWARIWPPGAGALDGRVLRAAQFQGRALPPRARALHRDGHGGRCDAGPLSKAASARTADCVNPSSACSPTCSASSTPRERARPRLHPRRHQLRPHLRRPHASLGQARAGCRRGTLGALATAARFAAKTSGRWAWDS